MAIPLQVLIIEDTKNDAELILHHLGKAGFSVSSETVETAETLKAALDKQGWDIIISDYSLPAFSAPSALSILQESGLDIPFIVVSGSITEKTAIDLMRAGAADYLMKDRLARLAPLVTRELNIAQVRRERNENQAALQKSQEWSNLIYSSTSDSMFLLAVESNHVYHCLTVNAAYLKSTGLSEDQVVGKRPEEVLTPQDAQYVISKYQEAIRVGRPIQYEETNELPRGIVIVETTLTPIFDQDGRCAQLLGSSHEITERKQAEVLFRESEEKFRQIVERSNDVFYRQDINTAQFEYVSPKVTGMLGYTPQEFLSFDLEEQIEKIHPEDLPGLLNFREDLIQADLRGENHVEREYRMVNKQGEYRWIHGNYTLVRDADNNPLLVVGSLSDITERKRVEQELRETQALYLALIENQTDPVCRWLPDTTLTFVNKAYCDYFGKTSQELIGTPFKSWLPQDTQDTILSTIDRLLRREVSTISEEEMNFDAQGNPRWMVWAYRPITDRNGEIAEFQSVGRDITERKRVEESLRLSEEKFSTAFRISPNSININRVKDGLYIEINEGFTVLTGYTPEDVRGKTSIELDIWVNPQDRDQLVKGLREHGEVTHLEAPFRTKNGQIKICQMSARIIEINQEMCILSVTRDITDRKRTEEALRKSEARYRALFEQGPDGVVILNPETGQIIEFNDLACRQLGYTREEFGRLSVADIEVVESAEEVKLHIQKILAEGHDEFETRQRTKQGEIRDIHVMAQVIEAGNSPIYHCIWRDITGHKQAEQALRESEDRFRSIFENITIGMFQSTPEGKFIYVNPAISTMLGYASPGELIQIVNQTSIADALYEDPARRPLLVQQVEHAQGHWKIFENPYRCKDGHIIDTILSFSERADPITGQRYLYGFVQDITERKQAENKINEQLEELRRWHNITLGREDRILELKGEVNRLLAETGNPPRYTNTREAA